MKTKQKEILTTTPEEITDSDIFVNCIYLTSKIPNFGMCSSPFPFPFFPPSPVVVVVIGSPRAGEQGSPEPWPAQKSTTHWGP